MAVELVVGTNMRGIGRKLIAAGFAAFVASCGSPTAYRDAYSELNKNDDAVTYYKKAAEEFTDDIAMSSEYLFRAALKLETTGKNSEALELYKELKQKYPTTERGFAADKYIYRLSIVPNDFSVSK